MFILIEQSIAATSTIWIVKMGENINNQDKLVFYFSLFVLSLIVVYIPSSLSNYFLELSVFKSFHRYISIFNRNHYGNSALSRDINYKNSKEPFIINESWVIINDLNAFYSTYLRTAINIIFSVAMLSYVINKELAVAYVLSIIIITIALILCSPKIKLISSEAQNARIKMIQVLSASWDNVLIGNRKNYSIWGRHFNNSHVKSKKSSVKSILWVEFSTNLTSIIAMTPIIYVLLDTMTKNLSDIGLLTALIATLPRQIMTVHYISDIALFSNEYSALKAQISGLVNSLYVERGSVESNISWDNISIQDTATHTKISNEVLDAKSLKSFLKKTHKGRYTVSGPNGCGKSSLLLFLKENYGDNAYYLPAHSNLFFQSSIDKTLSTGEKQICAINELKNSEHVNLLLLDEWDANLDSMNTSSLSITLDELSNTCCILEVRH